LSRTEVHVLERSARRSSRVVLLETVGIGHRTGDVGYLDRQGCLHLVGRVHNAILRAGELLYPVTPEILMRAVDGVRNGAYVGLPDPALGEAAVAVISLTEAADRGRVESAVRHALRGAGAAVDRVLFVPEIPMDPRHHSKVEYERLRATLLGGGR
jgi:acyl-CoA synthetase (AMP-forming)/AMP-acid ligase II